MVFKDSPDGQTHYVGDGCTPPHENIGMNEATVARFEKLWRELGLHLGYKGDKGDKGDKIKQFFFECLKEEREKVVEKVHDILAELAIGVTVVKHDQGKKWN